MIEVGKKSKLNFHWQVSPYDYSKERVNEIKAKASKKYGIPKEQIKVTPEFITIDENGNNVSSTNDIIQNIQDPEFQIKLFSDYLSLNGINDYNFDLIKKIDSEINGKIDYQIFDKYRKYSIKWIKWDNFLSYGSGNVFDFTRLNGLVLLNGDNQSGKTTFAIDLIHFLLFGKTEKVNVQDKVFNKHLPEATKVVVEGCLIIEGEEFVIKRTLTRPAINRRTDKSKATQKVEYYKIVGDSMEELVEYVDNQQEENSVQTNKKIKEAIGREDDFELVMSITESNLDSLIDKKETERGRLLSRWIGLLPLEQKDIIAREKFNQEVKPYLLSNRYDIETLSQEIKAYEIAIEENEKRNKEYKRNIKRIDKEISEAEKIKSVLLSSKQSVDENLLKVDISTVEKNINDIKNDGIDKKERLSMVLDEIKNIGEIDFSVNEYDSIVEEKGKYDVEKSVLKERYKTIKHNIDHLKSSEFCPTCGKKLDNVDNSAKIDELTKEMDGIVERAGVVAKESAEIEEKLGKLKSDRDKFDRLNKLSVQKSAFEVNIAELRNKFVEMQNLKKEYLKNSDAINKNNEIEIEIRNNDAVLTEKRKEREMNSSYIVYNDGEIKQHTKEISDRKEMITKLNEESILVKNWKIYLDMVGKNGVSKMVLRKTLPIINARLGQVLSDVCDFDVEVYINKKNEVSFNLVKDGVTSDLSSGSGFEKTAASLALRFVLSDISTIPRGNGVMIDEVWGRTTKENLENLSKLINKALKSYDYMFIVAHVDEVKSLCDTIVNVKKVNNVSKIEMSKNVNK